MTRERPILFAGPMVRAVREGRKTQTRRLVKPQPEVVCADPVGAGYLFGRQGDVWMKPALCPYGAPAGPWQTFRDRPPNGDGWYDVRWKPGDEPRTVYLRCVTDSDEPDLDRLDPTSWLWGKDERDDPEAISLDVADPWSIAWRAPGDRLWVRETWATYEVNDPVKPSALPHDSRVFYLADGPSTGTWLSGQWRPSIHMPRWASRLTLAIEAVRVERLQGISEADARAEGVDWASPEYLPPDDGDREDPREVGYPSAAASFARDNFRRLWDSLNDKSTPWESNPWVWVITFRVLP